MSLLIQIDLSNVWGELSLPDLLSIEKEISEAHATLMEGTGAGASLRGWLDLPDRHSSGELLGILGAAETIRSNSDVCVIVGIGGSCLSARGVIELLQGPDRNLTRAKGEPQIFYAGNNLSTRQWNDLKKLLEGKDFSVIAISKSGTTTETAIALRSLRWMLERKYGTDEANRRIYAVTDPIDGALRQMADANGWTSFPVPPGVGTRFSALSAVGLLPMAVAGIDIVALLEGAGEAKDEYDLRSFENPVWLYAAVRNLLYRRGKAIELLCGFEPGMRSFGRWWQKLFAESEGKQGKGLFPVAAEFTEDLHSLGQLIQDGQKNLFETVLRFDAPEPGCIIGSDVYDPDGLNCLADKALSEVEEHAFLAALTAHSDAGVSILTLDCGELSSRNVGQLIYFLELSCAVSAYTMGVNPFNQSGVEPYRTAFYDLIGKPCPAV